MVMMIVIMMNAKLIMNIVGVIAMIITSLTITIISGITIIMIK